MGRPALTGTTPKQAGTDFRSAPIFSAVVSSCDLGVRMPEQEAFAALLHLHCPVHRHP